MTLCQNSPEGELVNIFSDAFAAKGDRSFIIGVCILGTHVKFMLCSHAGVVEWSDVDFAADPSLFAIILFMYASSTLADVGFNSNTRICNPFNIDDPETLRVKLSFKKAHLHNIQAKQPVLDDISLTQKIASRRGIVGRTTVVYQLECPNYDLGLVMKYSWQEKTRRPEYMVIRVAREADPVHIPELLETAVVEDHSPLESLRATCC